MLGTFTPHIAINLACIKALLLSENDKEKERARDILAGLLTNHKGEYILRLGARPHHSQLFAGDASTSSDGWIGTPRTEDELQKLCGEVSRLVEEVGGKVCICSLCAASIVNCHQVSTLYPFSPSQLRTALLLRLPPPSVSLLAEVRCAVVGNVDSGKSTTLGVLTRGIFTTSF